jgi:hypothetical protein
MIPADRGLAALAEALADHLGDAQAASYIYARAILGDRAVFLPDGDCGHDPKGEAAAREFVESITVDCGHKATIVALRAALDSVPNPTDRDTYEEGWLDAMARCRAALAAQEADHDPR